jgi:hypothetical protein
MRYYLLIDLSFELTPAGPRNTRIGGSTVRVGEGMLYDARR